MYPLLYTAAALAAFFVSAELVYFAASKRTEHRAGEPVDPKGREIVYYTTSAGGVLRVRRKPYYRPIHFYLRLWGAFVRLARGREAAHDWRHRLATTQGRDVYLNDDDGPATPSLLLHEARHVDQVERDGLLRYSFNYTTRPKMRAEYELECYGPTIREAYDKGGTVAALTVANVIADMLVHDYFVHGVAIAYLVERGLFWANLEYADTEGCPNSLTPRELVPRT